jgi:hypothetical protein
LGRADESLLSRLTVNTAKCRNLALSVPDDTIVCALSSTYLGK